MSVRRLQASADVSMLIASPNLSLDRMIQVSRFDAGHVHRAERVEARIGGGGANIARVAVGHGLRPRLLTLKPQQGGETLVRWLGEASIDAEWVECGGQLRVATILREGVGRTSLVNEPGPRVDLFEWDAFIRLCTQAMRPEGVLICSGSLPPGAPEDSYARLSHYGRHVGLRTIVDASGPALAATVESGDGLVTPNLTEAEGLVFGPTEHSVDGTEGSEERARDAANRLVSLGAPQAVVTAGAAGAAFAQEGPRGARGWVAAPRVRVDNAIGAGDAFACGLAMALGAGARLDDAVSNGVHVAAEFLTAPRGGDSSRPCAGRQPA